MRCATLRAQPDHGLNVRLAYAGTAPFGADVLEGLLDSRRHEIVVVVTRPDKPRGRHGTPQPSNVKQVAVAHGIPVLQPQRLSGAATASLVRSGATVMVVCAFGEIINGEVLDRIRAIVVHPSAVPRWRGAAPVERALMAGETHLGVAVLRMTEGVDEGPVGAYREVVVPRDADAGAAYTALLPAALDAVLETLQAMDKGTVVWRPQEGVATYARKLQKADRRLDWSRPAQAVVDHVRALSPHIGAHTELAGRQLTVWRARVLPGQETVDERDRLVVPAADGLVEILEIQSPGGKRQAAETYLRGAGRWLKQK